ncbi:hypothetical protein Dalk_1450 [Desulfatibacillum aliphaticivorans]|uniref:DarT domain-containing protein n=1 Tax=Desulfatibacillum aliphaticivorans TaxID=218208 RepID=B8FA54_DESAL|nr:DUF4433 domain-containing protein [Desulfatibacillum aliphaticivorans]ACL03150.1 hypothetical protein Dalk_1450 [Desulfatibacillum aliphaticivorans]
MSLEDCIKRRDIEEIVHYTTMNGLIGILATKMVKSRERVAQESLLEYILQLNTPLRKDTGWLDYVSLSISNMNSWLFHFSSKKWHTNSKFCILSFKPEILSHNGVFFATTNNMYPAVRRGEGETGFEALFAPIVLGRYNAPIIRSPTCHDSCPTCEQAEILYPGELSTDFLLRIYVEEDDDEDSVHGIFGGVGHAKVPVEINPGKFRGGTNT